MNTLTAQRRIFRSAYLAFLLGFVLLSCGDDDGSPAPASTSPEEPITASYNATLTTNFSEANFPQDYPAGASFGTIVVIVHDPALSIFQTGQVASEGFRTYIENGDVDGLASFIQDQVGEQNEGAFVVQSAGTVPAVGSNTFSLGFTPTRTRVTVIANLNPSPDWFIGVSSFDITDGNTLIENESIGLRPLDAGVRGGDTYEAPETTESAAISLITGEPFTMMGGLAQDIGSLEITRVN